MRAKLPPLNALRAFDATARHLSATKAADELCVTQGAVSRQIHLLEGFLRLPLFVRSTRKLSLTPEGDAYYRAISGVFDIIAAATPAPRPGGDRRVLKISVLPTISSFWLMPRLASFSEIQGDAEVRIINSIEPVDFQRSDVDLAIRVGKAPGEVYAEHQPRIEMNMVTDWKGVQSDVLFPDVLTPVCSRDYRDAVGPFDSVADLADAALIHVTTRRYAWQDWMATQGLVRTVRREDLYFGHFFMALDAARAGKGVAIVPTILLHYYERAGDLIRLFPFTTESAGRYRLLFDAQRSRDPVLQSFRAWVLEQAHGEHRPA